MENACAVVFEGRYYLALGGNVYIADGHLNEEDGYPAWFFWTNVPGTVPRGARRPSVVRDERRQAVPLFASRGCRRLHG